MIIKSRQLARVLFELIEDGAPNMEDKFLSFVKDKKLEAMIPSVLYRLEKMIEQDREEKGIEIEVPHPLSDNTKNEIKKFLKAEKLEDYVKQNKSLIAGFRAKWQGVVYDASLSNSLQKLEQSISA